MAKPLEVKPHSTVAPFAQPSFKFANQLTTDYLKKYA